MQHFEEIYNAPVLYQIRVDYPVYLGKGRGRGAGGRGEKTLELEKGVIKADLVLGYIFTSVRLE